VTDTVTPAEKFYHWSEVHNQIKLLSLFHEIEQEYAIENTAKFVKHCKKCGLNERRFLVTALLM